MSFTVINTDYIINLADFFLLSIAPPIFKKGFLDFFFLGGEGGCSRSISVRSIMEYQVNISNLSRPVYRNTALFLQAFEFKN